jgi:hypothetical protein
MLLRECLCLMKLSRNRLSSMKFTENVVMPTGPFLNCSQSRLSAEDEPVLADAEMHSKISYPPKLVAYHYVANLAWTITEEARMKVLALACWVQCLPSLPLREGGPSTSVLPLHPTIRISVQDNSGCC